MKTAKCCGKPVRGIQVEKRDRELGTLRGADRSSRPLHRPARPGGYKMKKGPCKGRFSMGPQVEQYRERSPCGAEKRNPDGADWWSDSAPEAGCAANLRKLLYHAY